MQQPSIAWTVVFWDAQAAFEPDDLDISLGDLIHFPMFEELVDVTDPGNLLNAEDSMGFEEESLEQSNCWCQSHW